MRRRWGRRSETYLFGSRKGSDDRFGPLADGTPYDLIFVFDDMGYNFEPSEIMAAYGLVQMDKLAEFNARRQQQLRRPRRGVRATRRQGVRPRTTEGVETTWMRYPFLLARRHRSHRGAGVLPRAQHPDPHGVDRQHPPPARLRQHPAPRCPTAGLPNTDRVMDRAPLAADPPRPDERRRRPSRRGRHRLATLTMAEPLHYEPSDPDFAAQSHEIYRRLHDEHPVYADPLGRFSAISRFDDVLATTRNWETFSNTGKAEQQYSKPTMNSFDPPHHTQLRALISRGFTPRLVSDLEPSIRVLARTLLDNFVEQGKAMQLRTTPPCCHPWSWGN